jgi:hypothetical protein
MRERTTKCLLAVWLLSASVGASAGEDCARAERDAQAQMTLAAAAADMDGALRTLHVAVREAAARCPDSEPLSYIAARTGELGYGDDPRASGPSPQARQFTEDAMARHPDSVRLATVLARIDGSSASARHAYDLDKTYVPARLALALALANEGNSAEALKLVPAVNTKNLTVSAGIARARVLLAAGRGSDAVHDASAARKAPGREIEIVPPRDLERDAQEVWGLALIAAGQPRQAAPHLKTAAALGSARASAALRNLR